MIDTIDDRLEAWTNRVESDATVTFAAPGREKDVDLGLYLIDLLPDAGAKGAAGAPVRVLLRYLVSASSQDSRRAHRLLGRLVVAALQETDFEVELAPPAPALWSAFGVEPRPCFFLKLPLTWDRPSQEAPLVRFPLSVHQQPLRTLIGQVLAPGDVPLRDAVVEWRGAASRPTDSSGRFRIDGFAQEADDHEIRVRLRRHEFTFPFPQEIEEGQPMTIRLGELEV